MAFNQAAMAAFADYTVANCNGRTQDLAGNDLNVDGRYGYQCMDLWIWARYRLGFTDNIPTPDAAAVWEMNWTAPTNRMWDYFDAITPDQAAMPGDFGIMTRAFFGNGVGHIFMILADLGNSIRVIELNGLGDGFEDSSGGQHGSPARIHDWPKTHLYGYLRWIGTSPTASGLSNTITPITEDTFMPALSEDEQRRILTASDRINGVITDPKARVLTTADVESIAARVASLTLNTPIASAGAMKGRKTSLGLMAAWNDDHVIQTLAAVAASAASDGATVDQIKDAVKASIAESVIKVDVTVAGGDQ